MLEGYKIHPIFLNRFSSTIPKKSIFVFDGKASHSERKAI